MAALVTGAGAGLGRAITVGLAQFGADVAAADIDDDALAQTVQQARSSGHTVSGIHCDASQPQQIKDMFLQLDQAFGKIDILVNNVGVIARAHPEDVALEDWQRVLDVNLTGSFLCAQEAGRRMIARERGAA